MLQVSYLRITPHTKSVGLALKSDQELSASLWILQSALGEDTRCEEELKEPPLNRPVFLASPFAPIESAAEI